MIYTFNYIARNKRKVESGVMHAEHDNYYGAYNQVSANLKSLGYNKITVFDTGAPINPALYEPYAESGTDNEWQDRMNQEVRF